MTSNNYSNKINNYYQKNGTIYSVYHWESYHLLLGVTDGKVSECKWITADESSQITVDTDLPPLMLRLKKALDDYFARKINTFDLPLLIRGTAFQRKVWETIASIPYGKTITYGMIASRLGLKGGAQAVGNATGSNHIALIIPCHRVIGANGKLTGYTGGLDVKRRLLNLERHHHSGELF